MPIVGEASRRTQLVVRAVTKTFPGIRALDEVSLEVRTGEIVALLGQNGSGKSTLVKVLAGIYRPDSGEIRINEPTDGHAGLHFIHQDLGLVESLSTIENLGLGKEAGRLRPLHRRRDIAGARALIARFGVELDVQRPIRNLSPAERTVVAIARAMSGWTTPENVLVLDEPTAALHGDEVGILFSAVRRVAEEGAGVIFISHRLEEVTQLADRVVVLRDGKVVADRQAAGLDPSSIAELITGRPSSRTPTPPHVAHSLSRALAAHGLRGGRISCLDLELAPGEVVGVAGTLGSGREDICSLLYGSTRRDGGTVEVNGVTARRPSPHHSMKHGLAFVPSDRRAHGAVMTLSVRENLTLPELKSVSWAGIQLRTRREHAETRHWMRELNIQPPMSERPLGLFSGGNQQKAVIAKWLRLAPSVLLVDEPTQGVDVGSSESIRALLVAAAANGMAILVTSSDNADLVRMCSRVVVMRDGVAVCELRGNELTDHRITQECLGASLSDVVSEFRSPAEAADV
jgi:ABC-type sugar transport system ATPase subunit